MLKAKLLGATAAAESLAIEDVFSTYLYTGNGSTQTITNGIDLAGEGGLVWIKSRSAATDNFLFDTIRGTTKEINSNSTGAEATLANSLTAFNANGFSIGSATGIGVNAATYASWTFRKAERFFDVVTYTGNGATGRQIAHDLGVVPGCIIVKCTSLNTNWVVHHRSLSGANRYLELNTTIAQTLDNDQFGALPTASVFTVGPNSGVNRNGDTYVAYLFAHDPLGPSGDGSDGLIACGTFTGNTTVTLGWEPQWILIKPTSTTGNWDLHDNMRGWPVSGDAQRLKANLSDAEDGTAQIFPNATGFSTSIGSATHIYIAIRRGPMREPTSGTEVFNVVTQTASAGTSANVGFPVDTSICTYRTAYNFNYMGVVQDRLRGYATANTSGTYPALVTNSTQTETALSPGNPVIYGVNNSQTSISFGTNAATGSTVVWNFRRAPGFFDVVAYTGDGVSNRQINHNLGVAPELTIIKVRDQPSRQWFVRCSYLPNPNDEYFFLSLNNGLSSVSGTWLTPTETTFGLGIPFAEVNNAGWKYISYHFATLPGVSKVGSYTGNGSSQTINCGFTTGARFVLIKRTDSTGDWYVWDTARGIVTGDDPHLSLNTTAAEVTTNDTIDPDSTGFIVNQVAATNVNVNAATYIFLAIA
jgi:hypothetical protein